MRKSRFHERQIMAILLEANAATTVEDICRKYDISPATFYKWKKKYSGASLPELARVRQLEFENARLNKIVNFLFDENNAIKDVIRRK